eukprot:CAMPEP_0201922578 /NCGR_PEP_ID=MMETSP0903-20130614/10574_1 /ASSEMBLY_ACC=CAM_ASM_000552 /TAXON_ID=420261 /ORGANISM="Thalassiosira antarctica, Strain CCMP982" /LENGTH=778 /DNA_ID=CAMNT_0048459739 /DNA_START=65 /DNA_END=2401 /DNA_ORIENTATION=+
MDREWLSRNPSSRKRDRRSYDNEWSTYEARGSGRSGGQYNGNAATGGLGRFASRQGGQIDRNNITAEGERVGITHDQYPRQGPAVAAGGASNYGGNASSRGGGVNSSVAGSRIRVADYRGAAARVGALPTKDGPPPSIFQSDSSFKGGGKGGSNDGANGASGHLFQNEQFLKSLANPPPVTVNLPSNLRSALNDEQCKVVESVLSGHSTFFTGPAGSGKSHILSTLLKANEQGVGGINGQPRKIVVTATTGVAACNVGGITIHSFAGVGLAKGSPADLAKRVMGNEQTKGRWREVNILVIDEISMMAGSFLDKLSFIASRARNDRRPFGGVQLVVCGDFFQLPPVELSKDGFAFEAKCWSEVIKCSVLLKQVFRQRGDQCLMNILDEARTGELSAKSAEVLRRHGTLPAAAFDSSRNCNDDAEKIIPTLLECRNRDVDKANEREMAKLPGEIHTFKSRDRAVNDAMKGQLKGCQAPPQLDLKIGAQVMLLKNIDLEKGLANGSRGVVVGFQRPKSGSDVPTGFKKMDLPVVKFDSVKAVGNDKEGDDDSMDEGNEFTIHPEEWANKMGDQTVSSRLQIPLRLAWSISVHKSQGMTIPNLTVNLAGVFEYGQAYVALSRATELKLLTLRGFSAKSFRAHPKVKAFYSLLDGGRPNLGQITNKENVVARHHDDHIGDLPDPFEGDQTQRNPYNSGRMNPYSQRKQASSFSTNPYQQPQRQSQVQQTAGRFSPVPQSASKPPPTSTISISPTHTQDQINRMAENRRLAIQKRMKKQNDSSH